MSASVEKEYIVQFTQRVRRCQIGGIGPSHFGYADDSLLVAYLEQYFSLMRDFVICRKEVKPSESNREISDGSSGIGSDEMLSGGGVSTVSDVTVFASVLSTKYFILRQFASQFKYLVVVYTPRDDI